MRCSRWAAMAVLLAAGCGGPEAPEVAPRPTALTLKDGVLAELGRRIFEDAGLSRPPGQSCASCHDPHAAFTDPDRDQPTSEGVIPGRFGTRNSPTAAYAAFVPPLRWDAEDETFVGGLFLDGRVDSLEEQAGKPFLNPAEMNQPDEAAVVSALRARPYAPLFAAVFGQGALDDTPAAYRRMTAAIAAFERTRRFAPFSSRYDAYLAGRARLTTRELRGLALFEDPAKGNCAACHPSRPGPRGEPPLFTDFTYDNIGIPRNPAIAAGPPDRGLGATVGDAAQDGKFRVPTLRNIAITAPYGHNGFFRDLRSVVEFYDTRDVRSWPAPEIPATVNHDELGDLGLSADEIDDIVAFLRTLTDRAPHDAAAGARNE